MSTTLEPWSSVPKSGKRIRNLKMLLFKSRKLSFSLIDKREESESETFRVTEIILDVRPQWEQYSMASRDLGVTGRPCG